MYNLLSLPKLVSARVIVDKVETFSLKQIICLILQDIPTKHGIYT